MSSAKLKLALSASLLLSACGSDDNTTSTTPPVEPAKHLAGTLADGGAIRGLVENNAQWLQRQQPTPVKADGHYQVDTNVLVAGSVLKIEGVQGGESMTHYSLVTDSMLIGGISNITPLTSILVSRITGVSAVIAYAEGKTDLINDDALDVAEAELRQVLMPLLTVLNLNDVSFARSHFKANMTGLDALLGTLKFSFGEKAVELTYIPSGDSVTLPYKGDWNGLQLTPQHEVTETELSVIYHADQLLESMALSLSSEDGRTNYEAALHDDAHWFGVGRDEMFDAQREIIGSETSKLDRFKDYYLSAADIEKGEFLLSYTEHYESNEFATAGRRHAWFKTDVNGDLKFLGDQSPSQITSANAFLKYAKTHKDFNMGIPEAPAGQWRLELDMFLSGADCDAIPVIGPWQFPAYGNPNDTSFVTQLPKIADHLGFSHVVVEGPGLGYSAFIDRIYHEPDTRECYLTTSVVPQNVMTEGAYLTEPAAVTHGSQFTFKFVGFSKEILAEKTITLGQGVQSDLEMETYNAQPKKLHGAKGEFQYSWSRSDLAMVVEGDVWAKERNKAISTRVSIPYGETQVQSADLDAVEALFHTAVDPFGRMLSNDYLAWGSYLGKTE